jgi:hypothetical protein
MFLSSGLSDKKNDLVEFGCFLTLIRNGHFENGICELQNKLKKAHPRVFPMFSHH